MTGLFYGVSVGPGDPEYMTLKAIHTIENCPVIAAPRTDGVSSAALEIARGAMDLAGKEIVYLDFLMVRDKEKLAKRHQELTETLAGYLDRGLDVAMLNLGDCSLYASYTYLREQLEQKGYRTRAIAGVTSFCACAARLGVSLTKARLPLRIVPGDYPELEQELSLPGTMVIMKSGKGFEKVQKAISASGRIDQARVVENCGMAEEQIPSSLEEAGGGYFSTVLIDCVESDRAKRPEPLAMHAEQEKGRKQQMQQSKQAIVAVSFGTSHQDALTRAIDPIERDFREKYPGIPVIRAFTSGMIVKKLRERDGLLIDDPDTALHRLAEQGVRHVMIQPTHLISGEEYDKLMAVCDRYREFFDTLKTGSPLLSHPEDFTETVQAVCDAYPVPEDTALVLMGHGSEHQANEAYYILTQEFRRQGHSRVFVGTVEAQPDGQAVLEQVKAAGFTKALLVPLMLVAGDHAKNDLAGEDEESWKSLFCTAGIQTECILRGLGEYESIRRIYTRHLSALLEE